MEQQARPMSPYDADVIINGSGPTGMMLAIKLALNGHRVIIVDRQPAHYPLPRAVTFDDEVARIISELGIDPDSDALIEHFNDWYVLRNAAGETIQAFDWSGETHIGWHRWYWFHQPDLEQRLAKILSVMPNVEFKRGWEAVGCSQNEERAELIIKTWPWDNEEDRQQDRLVSRYLIGADGANSFVRQAMNLPATDLGFCFDWLVVDIIPKAPLDISPPIWQLCDPARPTTLVPAGPGRRRWEFMALPGEDLQELNTEHKTWELLARWGVTPDTAELERHSVWRFQAKWCEKWREGRVLIAGDAAHLMPPFAGQGMCSGLKDAVSLGWRLDLVLRGLAEPCLLDTYGEERKQHVQYFIDLSMKIGEAICMTDPEEAARRDSIMKATLGETPARPEMPALGPGVWVPGDAGASFMSSQGVVTHEGKQGRFDEVVGGGWVIIGNEIDPCKLLDDQQMAIWKSLNGRTFMLSTTSAPGIVQDTKGVYKDWFSELGADAIIIRPDHYVAGSALAANFHESFDGVIERLHLAGINPRPGKFRAALINSAVESQ